MNRPALASLAVLASAALITTPSAAGDGTASMRLSADTVAALSAAPMTEAKASLKRRADRACRVFDTRTLEERRFANNCSVALRTEAERRLPQGGPILVRLSPTTDAVLLP